MHFLPIISTLRRHRTAASLIVLEIALTCAIVCNAIFLIRDRLARMDQPSGIAETELVRVVLTGIGERADAGAITAQDLVALRGIPGVRSVASTNMVPFGNSSWNSSISTLPDDPAAPVNAAMYMGSPDLLETFGSTIIAGRDFTPDEYRKFKAVQNNEATIPSVMITRAVAERLFPGKSALGQALYVWGKEPQIVVGVIDRLVRPNPGPDGLAYALVLPIDLDYTEGSIYLLRTDPARRAEVLAAVDGALDKVDPNRILLERQLFDDVRNNFFKQDRAMAYLLVGVSLALLIVTALGVIGLASFWVQQRTRQIGIRRALGATRGDILRYFQVENFILATIGIVVGMALAYAINLWLMQKYQVGRLPAEFLPIGALLLWLLGQIAVLGPAMRASSIPPALATRSV
ncbi:MAG: ABC transporter permease [Myxococcales bacterium]|nr:ABC transporter permease [Myxococcales bacterium]